MINLENIEESCKMSCVGGWRRSRFPGDSRTSVLAGTWAGLTAGFGMGPGVPRRYGRQNHRTYDRE